MLSKEFLRTLQDVLNLNIKSYKSISGGDISKAYYIKTEKSEYLIKTHSDFDLLHTEKIGLETIALSNTIATPKVFGLQKYDSKAFLILEWIDSKSPTSDEFAILGKQLAELHKNTKSCFGFKTNNFIGSLPQSNTFHNNWTDFYIEERLAPQLTLAHQNGLLTKSEIPNTEVMKSTCFEFFNTIKPTLLHGDLWSGNFLISTTGKPYLIDPSVYFGHNEIDIAMSKLFGGFSKEFYSAYHNSIPKEKYTTQRIELYQLYYLLAHLNMFGSSYYTSVKNILTKYF